MKRRFNKGFILMEVMVSLFIIALVLVSLFRMHSNTLVLAAAGKFYNTAPLLARLKLAEIEADPEAFEQSRGNFKNGFGGYAWQSRVTRENSGVFDETGLDFVSQEKTDLLLKIDLEIRETTGHRVFRLTTWRYADG